MRPRSVVELRRRLLRRFDEKTAQGVVQDLLDRGLLDDAAFAAAWRHSREQFRPRSSAMVRYELLSRGVERSVANEAVTGMDDESAARQAASKYIHRVAALDQVRAERRMRAYLARRGFTSAVVQRTIRWLAQTPSSA